jgi:hypothetical protein
VAGSRAPACRVFAEMPLDDIETVRRRDAIGEPPGCGLTDCEWRAQSMPAVEAPNSADKLVEVDPIGRRSRRAAAVLADLAPEEFAVFVAEQRLAERIELAAVPEVIHSSAASLTSRTAGRGFGATWCWSTPASRVAAFAGCEVIGAPDAPDKRIKSPSSVNRAGARGIARRRHR